MNLHLNLSFLDNPTYEDSSSSMPALPFIPLGALKQGLILYDYDFQKKNDEVTSEGSWGNGDGGMQTKSQENLLQPNFEYRAPEKLLENHSVISNSILIDFEKRILRQASILAANQKRVSFRESPRDSSSHRRSKSESKNLVCFKLELISNEEPISFRVENIDDQVF